MCRERACVCGWTSTCCSIWMCLAQVLAAEYFPGICLHMFLHHADFCSVLSIKSEYFPGNWFIYNLYSFPTLSTGSWSNFVTIKQQSTVVLSQTDAHIFRFEVLDMNDSSSASPLLSLHSIEFAVQPPAPGTLFLRSQGQLLLQAGMRTF